MEQKNLLRQEDIINLPPQDRIQGFDVRPGFYEINGASAFPNGVNFTIISFGAVSCTLLLFHRRERTPYARLPFPAHYRVGNVFSMFVYGLEIDEFEYAYSIDGPFEPEKGLIFDKTKYLLDPYAKAVTGQSGWGLCLGREDFYKARVVHNDFRWDQPSQTFPALRDCVIYELHVRGFTRHRSSGVENPGTFDGIREKIPYLKELGINAVELMPIFEFDETKNMRQVDGRQLLDYWGYNPVCFFAPNTSYASEVEYNQEGKELKELVNALHAAGIQVFLDVVFNHTAEGNEKGPVFSFKGFDNSVYYMLTPDGYYYNFSGCGNTLNCNHPIVQQMIVECLRYWTVNYRVDGFRFDLASILGRNEDGSPMNNPPLLKRLAFDPILGNVKLIAEAWDAGGLYQVGRFPAWKRWAEWNGKYRDTLRDFLKCGPWAAREAAMRITGSLDLYQGGYAGYNSSVNFLTCHDGFTLYDLYSYNRKHNEANGWNNTDGSDDNRSWNCGFEGETDDAEVLRLRLRMIRNACAVLMCSRGTPMFLAGDEFCNTQFGNNNPYCQDNEISWLDWSNLEKHLDMFESFRFMIAFRMEHPAIRRSLPGAVCGLGAVRICGTSGEAQEMNDQSTFTGILYAGYDREKGQDDVVYLAVNTHWEEVSITLPKIPRYMRWLLNADTYGDGVKARCCLGEGRPACGENCCLKGRTVAVFTAEKQ